ncbi:hypothetical protein [Streptomyces sp. NPDC048611]|uniref:hypothetical protein n=1 Tax=Streptomyces sp. NPDC048611 TaxID=3155635 RepID=UPI003442ADC0
MTVLWEAQHRGFLGAGAKPSELLDLLAGPVGSPESWGERVLQRSVLGVPHRIGGRIEAFTEDRPPRGTSSSPAVAALSPGSTPPHPRR